MFNSFFQRLLIAAALATGAPLIGAAIAPEAGIGRAQAADFTGRIKNIRIKKKRVGSGFKIAARTDAASANSVASADVTLRSAATGEVIEALELGEARRARVGAVLPEGAALLGIEAGRALTVELVDADGADGQLVDVIMAADGGTLRGEGVSANGYKVRMRVDRAGALRMVVFNEDGGWTGDLLGATVSAEGVEPLALSIDGVRQRRVATTDVDLEAAGLLVVETTLRDADGSVIDARTETLSATDDPNASEIVSIKAAQTRDGRAKLVTITQSNGQSTRLKVALTDRETGQAALEVIDESPVSIVRSFFGSVEFDEGEDPAGSVYPCLVDLIDANGDPIGEQYEVEVIAPEYIEGEATSTAYPIGDGLGELRMWRDDDGFHFSIDLRGSSEVMTANVIFDGIVEGSPPLEPEVRLEFQTQFEKWIQKGDAALPSDFEVGATLSAEEVMLGAVEGAAGSDPGTVYKASGNGKGTRKAAVQATQNQASQIKLL